MNKIAVIDYGMGNLRSVEKAIGHVAGNSEVIVTCDSRVVLSADRVVFPGQGAMPDCMRELEARGLHAAVLDAAASKPFLGICIGQQMLFDHSQEGDVPGLGVFAGEVRRFPEARMFTADGVRLKVPHMGWNEVHQAGTHALWSGIPDAARFYFVHSYYVDPADAAIVAATTDYGLPFTSAVARANIFAVQFHPEKSAEAGLQLLSNFIRWQPES
ncbi:imidazole glycerol phosphate synthase subunit HisH [Cognatazoarcus halotolerans]|uniref:imidazole glycerol phosphate synthase subunit HisH n=1 Tax=Cognatazoarcus halotolerans TaxID=2686016 RepID=UPI0013593C5F|nr:imidazole glycerol phosphate synthase subunit HisH [Cognatazoarcus halotolerans]MBX3678817.1 imidazole glycerol phosphate synthase subunit HisH [Rhodocyclaceae bacterium]MCB1900457.1 imidazole glycerol phosphate synthase subunit HisH [Rhodocyclaceae bacterium]MCP5309855.1 imidazole glycerol phosphate synthase subunit HisH [Zoogloeaceae bacterium]